MTCFGKRHASTQRTQKCGLCTTLDLNRRWRDDARQHGSACLEGAKGSHTALHVADHNVRPPCGFCRPTKPRAETRGDAVQSQQSCAPLHASQLPGK